MIRRRLWISLLGVVAVAVVLVGLNLGLGNTPVLGLDLQGGVSVILRPVGDASEVVLWDSHWNRAGVIARSWYIVVGE